MRSRRLRLRWTFRQRITAVVCPHDVPAHDGWDILGSQELKKATLYWMIPSCRETYGYEACRTHCSLCQQNSVN